MKLEDLKAISSIISLRRLYLAAGMNPANMRQRLKRGTPELSVEESAVLVRVMREANIVIVPNDSDQSRNNNPEELAV